MPLEDKGGQDSGETAEDHDRSTELVESHCAGVSRVETSVGSTDGDCTRGSSRRRRSGGPCAGVGGDNQAGDKAVKN